MRVISEMHVGSKSAVRTAYGVGDCFQLAQGLDREEYCRRCSSLYTLICMRKVDIGEELGMVLLYADDMALVTREWDSLQRTVERWNRVLREWGLRIKKGRTELMKMGKGREEIRITVDGNALGEMERFSYLGVIEGSD